MASNQRGDLTELEEFYTKLDFKLLKIPGPESADSIVN